MRISDRYTKTGEQVEKQLARMVANRPKNSLPADFPTAMSTPEKPVSPKPAVKLSETVVEQKIQEPEIPAKPIVRKAAEKTDRKVTITIRLSPEIIAAFEVDGPGWQTRINAVLLEYVGREK